jgi:hypothetical protein
MDVVGQLDGLLLGDYIKRKAEVLSEIIQAGVLGGKVDWLTAPKPTGTSSFPASKIFFFLVKSDQNVILSPSRRQFFCL